MGTNQIEIRNATDEDLSSIGSLHRELYRIHHDGVPNIFKEIQRNEIENHEVRNLEFGLENTIVATHQTTIVGYLLFSEKTIEESEILKPRRMYCVIELVVSSSMRGQKIGKMLLNHIEEQARSNLFDSVEVPVFAFNQKALKFYRANGYSEYVSRVRKELNLEEKSSNI